MAKGKVIGGTLVGLAILGGVGAVSCMERIDPGYVGVVYSLNGGIQGDVLTQGMHFVNPMHKITSYSVATEQGYLSADAKEGSKDNDSFLIPTADGKTVNVDLEYSYHFDVEKLPTTFTKFKGQNGKTIEQTFMRGKLKTWAGEVSSKFSVLDIYGERRTELNAQVLEHVSNKFAEYGIVIDSISFSRIGLDAQTEQAIQDRVNAQQELEKAKIETQKATQAAEKQMVEAEAKAEAARIAAQGEADAALIRAQAEAEANRLLSESLTDELLKQQQIDKWSGNYPQVMGDTNPILDLR